MYDGDEVDDSDEGSDGDEVHDGVEVNDGVAVNGDDDAPVEMSKGTFVIGVGTTDGRSSGVDVVRAVSNCVEVRDGTAVADRDTKGDIEADMDISVIAEAVTDMDTDADTYAVALDVCTIPCSPPLPSASENN
eukprot:IDg15758t1